MFSFSCLEIKTMKSRKELPAAGFIPIISTY
jgi:hypothetical protein